MECFLHIGTEKTATTSLQGFLYQNRVLLRNIGYFYSICGARNDTDLALSVYDEGRRDSLTKLRNLHSSNSMRQFQGSVLEASRKAVHESKCQKIIISSEFIQSRLTIEELHRLKRVLKSWGCKKVHVIVYLREPSATAASLYSTEVLSGGTREAPPMPGKVKGYENVCNHKETIKRFSKVFGRNRIIARIFAVNKLRNGSIGDDFLDCIGCSTQIGAQAIIPLNESISTLGLEILRRVNALLPRFVNHELNPARGDINRYFLNCFRKSNSEKYRMSSELRSHYLDYYANSNEWVRERFFPESSVLFEINECENRLEKVYSPDELDSLAEFIVSIWKDKLTT